MADGERYHALDALRGWALVLGVVLHGVMSFMPGAKAYWCVEDRSTSVVALWLFFTIHVFRLALFFVMAGFFARLVIQRKGLGYFIQDRRKRILIPLIVGWAVVYPLVVWVWIAGSGAPAGAAGAATVVALLTGGAFQGGISLGHLWFLYYLLQMYGLWLGLRWVARAGWAERVDGFLERSVGRWWMGLVMAVPVGLGVYWGGEVFGVRTPDRTLVPQPHVWVAYGGWLGLGWMLHRQAGLLERLKGSCWRDLGVAVVATEVCFALQTAVTGEGLKGLAAGLYGVAMGYWVFGLMGLFLRYLNAPSARWRYLADASYWMYIVHLPVVGALQGLVAGWGGWWVWKAGLVLGVTFPVLVGSYAGLVRYSFIGRTLNGERTRLAGGSSR